MQGVLRRRKNDVQSHSIEEEEEDTTKDDDDEDSIEECCLWLCILLFLACYPFVRSKWTYMKSATIFETAQSLSTTTTMSPKKPEEDSIKPVLQLPELVSDGGFPCKDLRRLTCKPPRLVTNIDYCGFNYLKKTEYLPKEQIAKCTRTTSDFHFKSIMLSSIFTVIQNPKGGCDQARPNHGYHLLRFDNSLSQFEALERMVRLIGNHWLNPHKIPVLISRYKWKFENSSDHNFFRNINKRCNFTSIPPSMIRTQTGHRNYPEWQKQNEWCDPGEFDAGTGVCLCPEGYGRANGECVTGGDHDDGAVGEYDPFMIAGPMRKAACDFCESIDFGPLRQNAVLTHFLLSDQRKDLKLFIARLRLAAVSLAVHVEKSYSVDRYTEAIEQMSYKYKLHQVVLVGSDAKSMTTIRDLLSKNMVVHIFDSNETPFHHALWAIGSCNHFIGTFSAPLSRLGFQLMVGQLQYVPPYISFDIPWCQTGIDIRKYPDIKYKMDDYICKPS